MNRPGPPAGHLSPGLLVVLGLLMTANPLGVGMYLPALSGIADDLDVTIAQAQLLFTGFMLGIAVGQLIVGMLSDALGRRRVLLVGLAVLTVATALVTVAPDIGVLLVLRIVQGLGAAASVVVARAVVSDLVRGPQADRAYSILMGMLAAGPFAAPLVGTLLLQLGGWRAIFLGMTGIFLVYLGAAWLMVPETLAPARRTPLRARSLLSNYARLLRDRRYVANALSMAFAFAALSVHSSASSFVTQDLLGADEWGFTAIYMAYAVAIMSGSMINASLAVRFGAARLMLWSQAVSVLACAALVLFATVGPFTLATFTITVLIGGVATSAVLANASALTLARAGFAAASGAALMGALQFATASAASPIGGVLGTHTGVPMALGMLGCTLISAMAAVLAHRAGGAARAPAAPGLPDPV